MNCLLLAAALAAGPARMQAEEPIAVTLEGARSAAIADNLELGALRKRFGIAMAELEIARTRPYNPEVELSYSTDRMFQAEGERDLELAVSQTIETGGKRKARMSLAEVGMRRARLAIKDRERTLLGDVGNAFYRALYQQQRLGLNQQTVGVTSALVATAGKRVKAGDAPAIEQGLAQAAHEKRVADGLAIQSELAAARLALSALTGRLPAQTTAVSGQWTPLGTLPEEERLVALALASRPDLEEKKLEIAVARASENVARTSRRPDVTLGLGYGRDTGVFDEQSGVPRLVDSDELLRFRVAVPIPIVNRRKGEIQRAQAEQQVASASVEALALEIRRQVLEARRKAGQASDRLRVYDTKLIPLVERNVALNREAYEGGLIDVITVLKAQDDLNEARLARLDAVWDLEQARVALETSVGRRLQEGSK